MLKPQAGMMRKREDLGLMAWQAKFESLLAALDELDPEQIKWWSGLPDKPEEDDWFDRTPLLVLREDVAGAWSAQISAALSTRNYSAWITALLDAATVAETGVRLDNEDFIAFRKERHLPFPEGWKPGIFSDDDYQLALTAFAVDVRARCAAAARLLDNDCWPFFAPGYATQSTWWISEDGTHLLADDDSEYDNSSMIPPGNDDENEAVAEYWDSYDQWSKAVRRAFDELGLDAIKSAIGDLNFSGARPVWKPFRHGSQTSARDDWERSHPRP